MILNCMVCNTEFEGPEPVMCCSGRDCGCMGLPVDPIICSIKCYNNLPHMKNQKEQAKTDRINEYGSILNNLIGTEFEIASAKAIRNIYINSFRIDDYHSRHKIKRKYLNWRNKVRVINKFKNKKNE
jgi:hypothetical protein